MRTGLVNGRDSSIVCDARLLDKKAVLRWEFEHSPEERDELAARSESFRRKFLVE